MKVFGFRADTLLPWIGLVVIVVLLSVGALVLLNQQRERLVENAHRRAHDDIKLVRSFVEDALRRYDYQLIDGLLRSWSETQRDIESITLTAANGFVLGHYEQPNPATDTYRVTEQVAYAYTSTADLELVKDMGWVSESLARLRWQVIAGVIAIGGVFWLLTGLGLRRWTEAVALRRRTAELDGANEALRREMAERKRMEEQFRLVVEFSPNAIVMVNPQGRIILVNAQTEKLFGYEREELIDKPVEVLVPKRWRGKHAEYRTGFFDEPRARAMGAGRELFGLSKDGREVPVEIGLSPIGMKERTAVISAIVDITERKRAAEERERLIAELEARNAELERFTYTVSHDLKSPLITIGGFLGLLEKDAAGGDIERLQGDIAQVRAASGMMQLLLEELLELSRIGRLVNPPEEVSLGELAREAVDLVAGRIAERGVQVDIAPDLPVVFGDRPRLREVLQNLIDNAVKFMGAQTAPRVEVGARQAGKERLCYVRDNGVGIDPRYHEKVFGLFERLDAQGEGTGLGLALIKRVVEVHGGRIWVESEGEGRGCTFNFTIPQKRESANRAD